ncbi:lectin-like domain-containing protein [Lacticaseibacillus zhaodongensis]|uniref:lectin-like domain-containing protein n=1 Tax=Lacticaseibacillus zhaodongensis TaxID=2668065 RepID=UPI0012D336EB|nr:LPXTG cell wall anchor domain-containing protein [Lacticaseibacillus zhaodongensis]
MRKSKIVFSGDSKLHYKMYKQGKHWLFAAICVLGVGMGGGQVISANAAEQAPTPSDDAATTSDNGLQNNTQQLQSSQAAAAAITSASNETISTTATEPDQSAASDLNSNSDAEQTPEPNANAQQEITEQNASITSEVKQTAAVTQAPTETSAATTTTDKAATASSTTAAAATAATTTTPAPTPTAKAEQSVATPEVETTAPATSDVSAKTAPTVLLELPAGTKTSVDADGNIQVNLPVDSSSDDFSATAAALSTYLAAHPNASVQIAGVKADGGETEITKDNFLQYFTQNGYLADYHNNITSTDSQYKAQYDSQTGIITLTPDVQWQSGNVTLKEGIDTTKPFTISGAVYLGDKGQSSWPQGADGISFGFHIGGKTTDIGSAGGSLGFADLPYAFGWKADTYRDGSEDLSLYTPDPAFDDQGNPYPITSDPSDLHYGEPIIPADKGHGIAAPFGAFIETNPYTYQGTTKQKVFTIYGTSDADKAANPQELGNPTPGAVSPHYPFGNQGEEMPTDTSKFPWHPYTITYDPDGTMTVKFDNQTWTHNFADYLANAKAESGSDTLYFFISGVTGNATNQQAVTVNMILTAKPTATIHYIDNGLITDSNVDVTTLPTDNEIKLDTIDGGTDITTQVEGELGTQSTAVDDDISKAVGLLESKGYELVGADVGKSTTLGANTQFNGSKFTFGDKPSEIFIHLKHPAAQATQTISRTTHYVDTTGATVSPDYTSSITVHQTTDKLTGAKTYTFEQATNATNDAKTNTVTLDGAANPIITAAVVKGYTDGKLPAGEPVDLTKLNPNTVTVTSNLINSLDKLTFDGNPVIIENTVVYASTTPIAAGTKTFTRTTYYVDDKGKQLATPDTSDVTVTRLYNVATDQYTYQVNDQAVADVSLPLNRDQEPTIKSPTGYTAKGSADGKLLGDSNALTKATNPAQAVEAAKTITFAGVTFDGKPQNVVDTVVYTKDAPVKVGTKIFTRTTYYVDDKGTSLSTTPDTSSIEVTQLHDVADDTYSYQVDGQDVTDIKLPLNSDATPKIKDFTGYTAKGSATENLTGKADALAKATDPAQAVEAAKTITFAGVTFDGKPQNVVYTVVYTKDVPVKVGTKIFTRTTYYVDDKGTSLSTTPDTSSIEVTQLHDVADDTYIYQVDGQDVTDIKLPLNSDATPKIKDFTGYTAKGSAAENLTGKADALTKATNPAQAVEAAKTITFAGVTFDGKAQTTVNTVVYTKNAPTVTTATITKTVNYKQLDGTELQTPVTESVTITKSVDAVTGASTYSINGQPVADGQTTLAGITNPFITGYQIITAYDDSQHKVVATATPTSSQAVDFNSQNIEYTVVYAPLPTEHSVSTIAKTVYYVDESGKMLHEPFTTSVTLLRTGQPGTDSTVTNTVLSQKPGEAILSGQAVPDIPGYTAFIIPAGATTDETVQFGDASRTYRVVYAKNPMPADNTPQLPPKDPSEPGQPGTSTPQVTEDPGLPNTFVPNQPEQPSTDQPNEPDLPNTFGTKNDNPQQQLADTFGSSTDTSTMKDAATTSKQLPQTGEQKQPSLIAAGLALLMSMLGLLGFRKREH